MIARVCWCWYFPINNGESTVSLGSSMIKLNHSGFGTVASGLMAAVMLCATVAVGIAQTASPASISFKDGLAILAGKTALSGTAPSLTSAAHLKADANESQAHRLAANPEVKFRAQKLALFRCIKGKDNNNCDDVKTEWRNAEGVAAEKATMFITIIRGPEPGAGPAVMQHLDFESISSTAKPDTTFTGFKPSIRIEDKASTAPWSPAAHRWMKLAVLDSRGKAYPIILLALCETQEPCSSVPLPSNPIANSPATPTTAPAKATPSSVVVVPKNSQGGAFGPQIPPEIPAIIQQAFEFSESNRAGAVVPTTVAAESNGRYRANFHGNLTGNAAERIVPVGKPGLGFRCDPTCRVKDPLELEFVSTGGQARYPRPAGDSRPWTFSLAAVTPPAPGVRAGRLLDLGVVGEDAGRDSFQLPRRWIPRDWTVMLRVLKPDGTSEARFAAPNSTGEVMFDFSGAAALAPEPQSPKPAEQNQSNNALSADAGRRVVFIQQNAASLRELKTALEAGRIRLGESTAMRYVLKPDTDKIDVTVKVGGQGGYKAVAAAAVSVRDERPLSIWVDEKLLQTRPIGPDKHDLGPTFLVFQVDSEVTPAIEKFTLRVEPKSWLYGQPAAIADLAKFDNCPLKLKWGNIQQAIQVDKSSFVSSAEIPIQPTALPQLLQTRAEIIAESGNTRSGGSCWEGKIAVKFNPSPDPGTKLLSGQASINLTPWLAVLAAPNRMGGQVTGSAERDAEERSRGVMRQLLNMVDRFYRERRGSFSTADVIAVSPRFDTTPPQIRELLVPFGRTPRASESVALSDTDLATLMKYESNRSSVAEALDFSAVIEEYRKLQDAPDSSQGPTSAVVAIAVATAPTPRTMRETCATWSAQMKATAQKSNVNVRAILAVNAPESVVSQAAIPGSGARTGGLYDCSGTIQLGSQTVGIYMFSFADLVEQRSESNRRVSEIAETFKGLLSDVTQ
jgi:hypothetical protein